MCKYSGDPNDGQSSYGTIQWNWLLVVWYSGHDLNNGLKICYSDSNFPNNDLNNTLKVC